MNTEKKKCFIYCRQSSGQEEQDHSLSLQQQMENCLAYARKNGLRVVDVFTDANVSGKTYPAGKIFEDIALHDAGFQDWFRTQSGYKKFRTGLGSMMLRLDETDFIVLDEITRLHRCASRSFLENVLNYRLIQKQVRILQVKGDMIDLSRFDQNLIQMLRTQINDEQIRNQKEKSRESRLKQKNQGIFAGPRLFGCCYRDKDNVSFSPVHAPVIREIFRMAEEGTPYNRICFEMNQNHAQLFAPAKLIYPSTVHHILRNPAYAGFMYNAEKQLIPCRNIPEPVFSLDYFMHVQRRIRERKRCRPADAPPPCHHPLPFSGLLICGSCGARMSVSVDHGRIFYFCRKSYLTRDHACAANRIFIQDTIPGRHHIAGLHAAMPPLFLLCREEEETGDFREKIRIAFEQFCKGLIDESTYRQLTALEFIRNSRKKIRCGKLIRSLATLPETEYRTLLTKTIRKITVFRDELCIELHNGTSFRLPRKNLSVKQRGMPGWTVKASPHNGGIRHDIIYDCRLPDSPRSWKTLLADFGCIRIFRR